jgi:hypothetical protein
VCERNCNAKGIDSTHERRRTVELLRVFSVMSCPEEWTLEKERADGG